MQTLVVTPEFLSVVAGALLSLFFSYFPGVNAAYAALDDGQKKLIMLGLLVLAVIAIFVMACYQVVSIDNFVCDRQTAISFLWMLVYAVIGNQGTFKLTPPAAAVKQAKSARMQ